MQTLNVGQTPTRLTPKPQPCNLSTILAWFERGRLNAKLGRWAEAGADFAQAIRIGCPVDQTELSGVPQLLLYAGESTAYEQLGEELRSREDDPFAVAIRGQLVGKISPSTAAGLAERVELMLSASRTGGGPLFRGENDEKHSGLGIVSRIGQETKQILRYALRCKSIRRRLGASASGKLRKSYSTA